MDIQPSVHTTMTMPIKTRAYETDQGQNRFHNIRYATSTTDRLQNGPSFAPAAAQAHPLAPHPAGCVCGCPQRYFPLFPERLIDVYC